jgi:hypothetical protein
MAKNPAKSTGPPEPSRLPKKKGRPRKNPPLDQPSSLELSKRDEQLVMGLIRKAILARKVGSLLELYEQRPQIRAYILDSYEFGELNDISCRPEREYLD